MDLTKKEIKAIEKFALACFEFKFAMNEQRKKSKKINLQNFQQVA